MQLFGRRARADSHGRFHLSCDEMAELYRGFHKTLGDTYWETASNHKICTDAMEAIRTTHISKKSGRFLKNFTALVREVYSHAHYNVQELLYEERDTIRHEYWIKITQIMNIVLKRAEHIWSTPCSEKLSILLQFATLFSLYKDVANEEYIQKIYDVAVNSMQFQQTHKNKKDKTDDDRMYDFFDQIQLTYRLRKEVNRRGSISEDKHSQSTKRGSVQVPPGPLMEHRQSRLATKDELDEFFDKIMKEQQRQRRNKQKPSRVDEEDTELDIEPHLDMWVSSSSAELSDGRRLSLHVTVTAHEDDRLNLPQDRGRSVSPNTRRRSVIHLPEIMSVIKKLNPVHHQVTDEPPPEMTEFDYKAEFEKRFTKKQNSVSGVSIELPVIAKLNPMDRVYSYRRHGLFNDRSPKRRANSESKPGDGENEETKENEEQLSLSLIPPPKPPRAHSPRTIEKLMIQSVINGISLDESVDI